MPLDCMGGVSCGVVILKVCVSPDVNCSFSQRIDLVVFVFVLADGLQCVAFRIWTEEFSKGWRECESE